MQRQQLVLILGVAIAFLAVFAVYAYIQQQRQFIVEQANKQIKKMQTSQVAVMVAKKDISPGSVVDASMIEAMPVPSQFVQPQAVTSPERIIDMTAVALIPKGQQITLDRLSSKREAQGMSLAMATPVGKRAVTIKVDDISSLAGLIIPGNYVDVIAMIPLPATAPDGKPTSQLTSVPLLQNVLVVAVGRDTAPPAPPSAQDPKQQEKKDAAASSIITVALTPPEANLISFVQEQAKIKFIMRSPADSQLQPLQPVSWETILRALMPQAFEEKKEEEDDEETPSGYLEIYRGSSGREKVPLRDY